MRVICCIICGHPVADHTDQTSWTSEFRGLYTGPDGVVLTGVSVRDGHSFRTIFYAPPDPDTRWDEHDAHRRSWSHTLPEDAFSVAGWGPVHGRRGFVFHDACWRLLQRRAVGPAAAAATAEQPLSLARLFAVCNDIPLGLQLSVLSWGHDYGGVYELDRTRTLPWQDGLALRRNAVGFWAVAAEDPHNEDEARSFLLAEPSGPVIPPPERALAKPLSPSTAAVPPAAQDDWLSRLPNEIVMEIAVHLPMADVLRARCASRSFWPTLYHRQFWASRFTGVGERSWLFEAPALRAEAENNKNNRPPWDWLWLYQRTQDTKNLPPSLRTRSQIWRVLPTILDACNVRWQGPEQDEQNNTHHDPQSDESPAWIEVVARVWRPNGVHIEFGEGCRITKRQQIQLPEDWSVLEVFFVRLGDTRYICGMAFDPYGEHRGRPPVRLGYSSPNSMTLAVSCPVLGFVVAVGPRGIQAIQCVWDDGQRGRSDWLGHPDGVPQTTRLLLVKGSRLAHLKASFDSCKMTGLAVRGREEERLQQQAHGGAQPARGEAQSGLRATALWYPDVPGPDLLLNEDAFHHSIDYARQYSPLFWTRFGGSEGAYLPFLTKVRALFDTQLRLVEFLYSSQEEGEPERVLRWGRCRDRGWLQTAEYEVDGPGGERIDGLGVYIRRHPQGEEIGTVQLNAIKLYTNRQRSLCLGTDGEPMPGFPEEEKLNTAPGTTITGFYGYSNPYNASLIMAIGVISEKLPNQIRTRSGKTLLGYRPKK